MVFGTEHYVPVLKVKRAEKKALQLIAGKHHKRITPLLEIVERREDKKPTIFAHLETAFKDLAESVRTYPRCFLDAREIKSDGTAGVQEAFRRARELGIRFTPVTGISRTADLRPALNHSSELGVAVRLTREEFEAGKLGKRFLDFVSEHHLRPQTTDVILDLGPVEDMIAEGIANFANQFLSAIPDAKSWRTLTMSASAFPKSMGVVQRRSHDFVERGEWLAWRDHLLNRRGELARLPTYSDCSIQHPAGVEGFDPRLMQISATIRYTLSENWLLVKGESTRRTLPSEQFPNLATQLVYGHLRMHFAGSDHCRGCEATKEAADGKSGFGSAEVWRRLGTIHHVTEVMLALNSLAES